jgi:tetratricopeptide (TPR) repeat protein
MRQIEDLLRGRQERLLEQVRRFIDQELRRSAEEQRKRQEERRALAEKAGTRAKEIARRLREMGEAVDQVIAKAREALGEKPEQQAGPEKPDETAPAAPPKKVVPEAYQKLLQAMRLYESGEYEKAIEGFAESVKGLEALHTSEARWSRAEALYRTACAHAMLGRPDPALKALEQAVHGGFKDIDKLDNDAELDTLREDPRFDRLYRFARSMKG